MFEGPFVLGASRFRAHVLETTYIRVSARGLWGSAAYVLGFCLSVVLDQLRVLGATENGFPFPSSGSNG